jgi:hypothetical protein
MRNLLVCVFAVCLGTLARAQSAPGDPFESTNPITLEGAVVGISSWSGIRGPESFLVFETDNAGRPQRWASRVAVTTLVQRGEPVVITGFAARKEAGLQELIPYSAVPMLAAIARAGRMVRATRIARTDGSELVAPAVQTGSASVPIFRITTDEFWLNLHHFLYVLGRAEAKTSDSTRDAVAGAPREAERGLKDLTADERRAWTEAVSAYAKGLSLKDAVREAPMPAVTAAMADAGDAPTLAAATIDAPTRDVLERAAPVYRKTWWPGHHKANLAWRDAMTALVALHGQSILGFITSVYGLQWPASGYAVHTSGYSSFGGAYSSVRGVLVISSLADSTQRLNGLETIFHEGMHQWDNQVYGALGTQARTINAPVPPDVPHALIWVTASEAVRRVEPSHVPLVDSLGIWKLYSSGAPGPMIRLKTPLEEAWKPYLQGRGTRDEALRLLLEKIALVK